MSTTVPPPDLTRKLHLYGDTMLDRAVELDGATPFSERRQRVAHSEYFFGGSAKIAGYLSHLLAVDFDFTQVGYFSPAGSAHLQHMKRYSNFELKDFRDLFGWEYGVSYKTRYYNNSRQLQCLVSEDCDSSLIDPGWYVTQSSTTDKRKDSILAFSDYNKGAISTRLVESEMIRHRPKLLVYDGYQQKIIEAIGSLLYQHAEYKDTVFVIKGSRKQWLRANCNTHRDPAIVPERVITILTDEHNPVAIATVLSGLRYETKCCLPKDATVSAPPGYSNGLGDLFTASCLSSWYRLAELSFDAIFGTLGSVINTAQLTAAGLLNERRKRHNPFWEIEHDSESSGESAIVEASVRTSPEEG
jgi:hypothetical protein